MAPDNFVQIKEKIQTSPILTSDEKKEWLYLLPKMKPEQIKELDRVLSIRISGLLSKPDKPVRPAPPPHSPVTAPVPLVPPSPPPAAPAAPEEAREEPNLPVTKAPSFGLDNLDIGSMKKASSVYTYLEALSKQMRELLAQNAATPEQIETAFEQSPLFKAYLDAGLAIMAGEEPQDLGKTEFEAITEFREALKEILHKG